MMNDTMNPNSNLDPQSPECALAHQQAEECEAYSYAREDEYARREAHLYAQADPLAHRGWPGDGSGEDDLADLMAHGDEGCCDGPGDW